MLYKKKNGKFLSLIIPFIVSMICFMTASAYSAEETFKPGIYYLEGIPEVGSELHLQGDGTFEYFLSYGAYDEFARGKWRFENGTLILTSDSAGMPPKFSLKSAERKEDGNITVLVQDLKGNGIAQIDVTLYFPNEKVEQGYTQYYGYSISSSEHPRAIGLEIGMYHVPEQLFSLEDLGNNYFVFEFNPGNLGQKQFTNTPLMIENGRLVMVQNGQKMYYSRQ